MRPHTNIINIDNKLSAFYNSGTKIFFYFFLFFFAFLNNLRALELQQCLVAFLYIRIIPYMPTRGTLRRVCWVYPSPMKVSLIPCIKTFLLIYIFFFKKSFKDLWDLFITVDIFNPYPKFSGCPPPTHNLNPWACMDKTNIFGSDGKDPWGKRRMLGTGNCRDRSHN